jgi:2-methylcitrate dehydratase
MTDEHLATELARYAADLRFEHLTDEAVEVAKTRLLDSLACALAAVDEPPVRALRSYARGKPGSVPVLWSDATTSAETAALADGGLIRYLDWNDTYLSLEPAHPSDNFGAILAAAGAVDSSGEEVLVATALAYELQCRLCDAASLRTEGFDHVNYGLVSATLAAGRLFGLDADRLEQAVNVAVNGHVALRQARAGELTEWKGFAFANVARNALVAVELADAGVHGPAPIFEGEFGFFEQVAGPFDLDVEGFGGRGGDFKLTETLVKYYPVEYHAQAAVGCVLDLLDAEDLDWRDVTAVRNRTYEAAMDIIVDDHEKWDPRTRETADHSLPYAVARALVDGRFGLEQLAEAKVHGDDVRELIERVEIEEDPGFTEQYGERFPHAMTVETPTATYERRIDYPKGHYENPLTRADLVTKFERAADGRLPEGRVDDVVSWVEDLESAPDLSGLFDRCTLP